MNGLNQTSSCLSCPCGCMNNFIGDEDLCLIDENKCSLFFNEGEVIFKQGSYVSQIAHIKTGYVKMVLEARNGRQTILNIISPDNFIGIQTVGNQAQYPFSVIALTRVEVCFIKEGTIREILNNTIMSNQFVLNWLANDNAYMNEKIVTISTRNSHGKLASALVYLTSNEFEDDVLNMLSRKELAEFSAISVESLNKILLQLKNDRIIELNKKGIIVKRRDLIVKLSAVG